MKKRNPVTTNPKYNFCNCNKSIFETFYQKIGKKNEFWCHLYKRYSRKFLTRKMANIQVFQNFLKFLMKKWRALISNFSYVCDFWKVSLKMKKISCLRTFEKSFSWMPEQYSILYNAEWGKWESVLMINKLMLFGISCLLNKKRWPAVHCSKFYWHLPT